MGTLGEEDTEELLKALRAKFFPNKVALLRPFSPELPEITRIAAFTGKMTSINGKATVYVCTNYTCAFPTTHIDTMRDLLNSATNSRGR